MERVQMKCAWQKQKLQKAEEEYNTSVSLKLNTCMQGFMIHWCNFKSKDKTTTINFFMNNVTNI